LLQIAKTFRLGRESLSPYSEKNQDSKKLHIPNDEEKEGGMKAKLFLDFVKVRLWKVAFYPSSTIPYVDTLAIGPFGGLKYDEVDMDDDEEKEIDGRAFTFHNQKRRENIYSQAYFDSFDDNIATGMLTASSPSHFSKPLRKNDRNLDLNDDANMSGDAFVPKKEERKSSSLRKLFTVKYCVVYLLDAHATVRYTDS